MIKQEYTNSEISAIIDEHIHNELYRNILKARYIDGLTFERIAEKYDMSTSQTKRIVYKNEWTILKNLKLDK